MDVRSFSQVALLGVALSPIVASTVRGEQRSALDSAGARFGFGANEKSESFHQAEVFVSWHLPWHGEFCSDWHLDTRLDSTGGWLHGHGDDAFVGSLGPSAVLRYQDFPLSLAGGTSPTFISRHEFGSTDLGCSFEFTTHADLNWDIGSRLQLGYRYQHMSNAAISKHNPGLNLHMFGVSYRF